MLPAARGLRTSPAVSLIFTGFSQPQLAPASFYLLGCTWLIYFVRPWEPMSRPWDGESNGQEGRGAWALGCPESSRREQKEGRRRRGGGCISPQDRQPDIIENPTRTCSDPEEGRGVVRWKREAEITQVCTHDGSRAGRSLQLGSHPDIPGPPSRREQAYGQAGIVLDTWGRITVPWGRTRLCL